MHQQLQCKKNKSEARQNRVHIRAYCIHYSFSGKKSLDRPFWVYFLPSCKLPFSTPTIHHGIIRVHSSVILVHNTKRSVIRLYCPGMIVLTRETLPHENYGAWYHDTLISWWRHQMKTFSRVTGHLCGEFTGPRWIPRTKASDAELWCFLWSAPE